MGKRKERRLAAKIGAGRRVKLDLFAEEPTGDLGGSSEKDEVGKEVDAKSDAELPNSPSSSGPQAENPLSLLGQYSDDELEEGSNNTASAPDGSLLCSDNQTKVSVGKPFEDGEVGGGDDHSSQMRKADNNDQEKSSLSPSALLMEDGGLVSNVVASDEKGHEVITDNLGPVPETSDTQTAGAVSSSWKLVLHEESSRYYYWNTVTGETSWEVPDVLAHESGLANELEVLGTEVKESAAEDTNASSAAFGVNSFPSVTGVYENGPKANQYAEQCKDGSQLMGTSTLVGALSYDTSTLGNYSMYQQFNAGGQSSSDGSHEVHGHSTMICDQASIDLPSHVITHAESLLERLKSLQGSGSNQQAWISKSMLEIEIRLSDLRSLSSHGLSLAPFWLHSERQLNQLKDAIITEIGEQDNKMSGLHLGSAEGSVVKGEDGEGKSKGSTNTRKLSPECSSADLPDGDASAVVQKSAHDKVSDGGVSSITNLQSGREGGKEINDAAPLEKASPKPEFQSEEDMDMDIDMEVEDLSPSRNRVIDVEGQVVTPSEQLIQGNTDIAEQELEPGEFIPPPPDEEWIPPPPPDSEGIPPPPPDEPPESCPPPPPHSELEPVQSVCNEQYNMTFAGSNVNYFENMGADASGSSFYEGSQIAALNPAVYYVTTSTMQPTAVPNPADSVVYYGLQNGVMPIAPVESTMGSTGFQAASVHLNYNHPSSKQIGTVDTLAGTALHSNKLLEPPVPGSAAGASNEVSSTSVVSAPATVQAKEFVSVSSSSAAANSGTVASTSAAISDALVAPSKPQSKASRMKRPKVAVASSLRSNKKVSSLVDKWKAAKEELQEEEEEERETPLEILEKKRRREIEEWRAQQIASGEAKENANFQPLGGDWRERVKRRRARKEAKVETSSDAVNDGTKQPDLNELSRDLPSGWQVYWDDSSRQVYYANSITSETTWTRPTR